ncbi:MAG TPA: AAA family ATPase, partial [Flavipsychrobacter sp.]
MNDKIGNISFYDPQSEGNFSKPYSEETGRIIDDEVRKLVDMAYRRTKQLLTDKIDAVRAIAEELLKKEVLYKDDLDRMIGKRPFEDSETIYSEGTPPVGSSLPGNTLAS